MNDRGGRKDRLVRDLRDLADAKRQKAKLIEEMASKIEEGEIGRREFREKCRENQILYDIL